MQVKLAVIVMILVVVLFQQTYAKDPETPANIVDRYCTLDLKGARLESDGMAQISKLTTFKGEPGWDTVIVSKSYRIGSSRIDGDSASVGVQYINYGKLEDSEFSRSQVSETITFKLKRSKDGWKIASPRISPHASKDSIIQHFQTIMANEGNNADLRSVVTALKALK